VTLLVRVVAVVLRATMGLASNGQLAVALRRATKANGALVVGVALEQPCIRSLHLIEELPLCDTVSTRGVGVDGGAVK
jgi:hypothetical protein